LKVIVQSCKTIFEAAVSPFRNIVFITIKCSPQTMKPFCV